MFHFVFGVQFKCDEKGFGWWQDRDAGWMESDGWYRNEVKRLNDGRLSSRVQAAVGGAWAWLV